MKTYQVAVIAASGALAGYLLYKYFKRSSKKTRGLSKNTTDVRLDKVVAILTRLKEGVCVAFGSFYPRSLLCVLKPEESEETADSVCNTFESVIQNNLEALCTESGIGYNNFIQSLDSYAEDGEEEVVAYKKGVEILKKLIKDPTNPTNHLSKDYTETYISELSREMLSKWKEECDNMIDEICIENQLTHFQLTQILLNNDIANTTYRDIIVRMHNRYKRIMKEISIEKNKNELELYASFTCYITSHSKLFLIPQECGDIAASRLMRIITPFKSEIKLSVEETMNNVKSIFENILKENKDLISQKLSEGGDNNNKAINDFFKDNDVKKSSLNIYTKEYDNEEEEMKIKNTMFNLKVYIDENNNEIKILLNDFSMELNIPYKFVMDYLTCSYQLLLLNESQKNAIFIDGYVIDTQSIVSCAVHLSEEENKSAVHELIKNYIDILKDENNEMYKMIKNERNVKIKSLLDIFFLSEESFDVLNTVMMCDVKRSEWCFKVIKDNNEYGSRRIAEGFPN